LPTPEDAAVSLTASALSFGAGKVYHSAVQGVVRMPSVNERVPLDVNSDTIGGNTAGELNWGTDPLRPPARTILENEGVLIDQSHGLQSRTSGLFNNVQLGEHGDAATKYLYTIDQRGINVIHELTPFPTLRGNVVHSNISSEASIGGEVWFGSNNSVTINAGSGRFGDAAGITLAQWDAAAKFWESLGYGVKPIPFGKR
jgi:hypothetical protein